jgi:hypothetical protein
MVIGFSTYSHLASGTKFQGSSYEVQPGTTEGAVTATNDALAAIAVAAVSAELDDHQAANDAEAAKQAAQ